MSALLSLHGTTQSFSRPHGPPLLVLRAINLDIHAGTFHSIIGKSGSGKSTLINVLALFETPSAGRVLWGGQDAMELKPRHQDALRRQMFGFVHQNHHLVADATALDNVALPLRIQGYSKKAAQLSAQNSLEKVNLGARVHHLPGELSGGERQRVALARALVANPRILIADEPTGNLDPETTQEMMRLLHQLRQDNNMALVVVTHDMAIAQQAPHQHRLIDGQLHSTQTPTRRITQ